MTRVREQFGMLVLFVLAGAAVAMPVSHTTSVLVIALLTVAVAGAVALGHFGARPLAFASLAMAGVLAPMNALRAAPTVTAADLFLVLAGVLAVIAQVRGRRVQPAAVRPPVRSDVLAAVFLIGGGVVGSQFAADLGSSLSAILRFGVAAVGVPLVFVAFGPSRAELRALAWAFLIGATVNSVVGVISYDPADRGIGLSTHSNHLAVGCLLASGFAVGLLLTSERRPSLAAAGCWAVVTVGILKSGSRAGLLGAAILVVLVLTFTGSRRILKWGIVVVLGTAVLLHLNVIPYDSQDAFARLLGNSPGADLSDRERAELRTETMKSIRAHPLTGVGFADARVAHNVYLQVWGAAGIVGLLGMAVLWNACLRAVIEGASGDRWLLCGAAGAVSFLAIAVASNILWDRYLWYSLAIVVTARLQALQSNVSPAGEALLVPVAAAQLS